MNLFEKLGDLHNLQKLSNESWDIFQKLHPQNESFLIYVKMIDGFISKMYKHYFYTPYWVLDYNKRKQLYWDQMKIIIPERRYQKIRFEQGTFSKN